jgi:hypothetical protein
MDKQALNSLIKQRVEEAVTNVQTDMLKHYFSKISKRKSTRIIRNATRQNRRDEF